MRPEPRSAVVLVTGSASQSIVLPDADADGAGQRRRTGRGHIDSYGHGRVCEVTGCATQLSRYNPSMACWLHDKAGLSIRRLMH